MTFPSALISHNGYGLAVTREPGISEVPMWQSTLSGPYPHVARSTWSDILTQIYPQIYTFYKNTFKVLQLSINMTLKTVSYALKKTSDSRLLLLLSENTLGIQDNCMLKTILSPRKWLKHPVLSEGNTAKLNERFKKLLPSIFQMESGWRLL